MLDFKYERQSNMPSIRFFSILSSHSPRCKTQSVNLLTYLLCTRVTMCVCMAGSALKNVFRIRTWMYFFKTLKLRLAKVCNDLRDRFFKINNSELMLNEKRMSLDFSAFPKFYLVKSYREINNIQSHWSLNTFSFLFFSIVK